jgi:hypothetical protein
MRNGILLAEDTPQNILTTYEAESLEDAFLQLCVKHGVSDEANNQHHLQQVHTDSIKALTDGSEMKQEVKRKNSIESNDSDTVCCAGVGDNLDCSKKSLVKRLQITTKRRMKALLAKNFLQLLRQPA